MFTLLNIACGSDGDGGMGPEAVPKHSHFEISVQMSSINAVEDCESTPGNPGDFRYRLVVRKDDEFGNRVIVSDTGTQRISASDGNIVGVNMEPIRFLVPRGDPDAEFQVEYWIGEYDGSDVDFENHSWSTHRFDRGGEQQWAAGTRYESYSLEEDGSGTGKLKFTTWSTRDNCKGAARYYVTWTPMTPEF
jgi:hypothetical protein